MRIQHITASHYLNHRSLNIPVDPAARVLFICGTNGSGKTGIAQGIRLALTGEPVRGLQYKNQLSELITQGERDGLFAVSVDMDGTEVVYRLNLRTGNYSGASPELPGAWQSLDPESFIAMPYAERRKLLFHLSGIQLKAEAIVKGLVEEGHTLERVQAVTAALRRGFDAATAAAKELASEARGGWKQVTGENYGSAKAATWVARVSTLDVVKESVAELEATVAAAKAKVDSTKVTAEQLRRAAEAHAAAADAQNAKDRLAENEAALVALQEKSAELSTEVEAIKQAAQYKGGTTCPCPKCGEMLFWNTLGVLKTWDESKPAMAAPEASKMVATVTQELAELTTKIDRVRQLVADGRAATKLLENLPPAPAPGAVREAEGKHQQAQAALAVAQADLDVARNHANEKERADARTKRAAELHADVEAYGKLAEDITELPIKYLRDSIGGVQKLLDEASAAFGERVTLGEDMELRYGTVPYGLASDSQQWRLRAAIGYALAVIGRLGVLVLDKFDVLQVSARGPVLGWLAKQQQVQVILCGTLKELPKLPEPPFQLVWLDGRHG